MRIRLAMAIIATLFLAGCIGSMVTKPDIDRLTTAVDRVEATSGRLANAVNALQQTQAPLPKYLSQVAERLRIINMQIRKRQCGDDTSVDLGAESMPVPTPTPVPWPDIPLYPTTPPEKR